MFDGLWREISALPEVTAISLGGSRSGNEYFERAKDMINRIHTELIKKLKGLGFPTAPC